MTTDGIRKIIGVPRNHGAVRGLEQNGLHQEKDKVKSLVDYIEDMETRLSDMTAELSEIRQAVGQIHDSTLRAKCGRLYTKAEKS